MLAWLTDPFRDGFTQRALAELLVLSLACGPLGVWILLYRQSYAAESISHGMLPGLVLAALAGAPLVLGAAGGVLRRRGRDRAGRTRRAPRRRHRRRGRGLGPVRARRAARALARGARRACRSCCSATCSAPAGASSPRPPGSRWSWWRALALAHRRLSASAFDPSAARSLGAEPARWELVLLVLLAVATVAAAPALGSLLLVALIVAPGAAALRLAGRLPAALGAAAAIAALAGAAGLVLSYHLGIAAGASVALCAAALAGAAQLRRT